VVLNLFVKLSVAYLREIDFVEHLESSRSYRCKEPIYFLLEVYETYNPDFFLESLIKNESAIELYTRWKEIKKNSSIRNEGYWKSDSILCKVLGEKKMVITGAFLA